MNITRGGANIAMYLMQKKAIYSITRILLPFFQTKNLGYFGLRNEIFRFKPSNFVRLTALRLNSSR